MRTTTLGLLILLLFVLAPAIACAAKGKAFTDPDEAGPDFEVQGEYVGKKKGSGGEKRWGVQVIARGAGKFEAVGYPGGLPGDGWNGKTKKRAKGETKDGVTALKGEGHTLTIKDGVATVTNSGGEKVGMLKKVHRESPTLGKEPPKGAVALFGEGVNNFVEGRSVQGKPAEVTEDGLLKQGCMSKHKAKSFTCHLEFRLPFMPQARGQGRGNSGYYVQGRYEIQMLDSFGLEGKDNECGGIYSVAEPNVNMCYPPLSWQTYDVDFTAPEFKDGKKVKNARITVRHNGVVIHDDLELPKGTPGGVGGESPDPGPVFLQDHGNPVRYRNIWIVEK